MATKSLSTLYLDAYATLAATQHAKYGNPTAEQYPAPSHVPGILACAVGAGILTDVQARKLAQALGRKAYGEVGLTFGVVGSAIDAACGFGALGMNKMQLEADLAPYRG